MSKTVRLGINTGFALNRFPEAKEWARIVAEDLGLKEVQFTADLLNPSLPPEIIEKQLKLITEAVKEYGLRVSHTFTSAFTRVNHVAHPDTDVRLYWIDWFKRFADISVQLGAESMGSHFGILTVADVKDQNRFEERTETAIAAWHEIAEYAKEAGLKYLTWEPMSVKREFGETLDSTAFLHTQLNAKAPLPIRLCLDVDHGDVASLNPDDTNPYVWLKRFAYDSPIIHIKQSLKSKGGHYPFVAQYNQEGKIVPQDIIASLEQHGLDDTLLLLELSFREREPFETTIIDDLKESVAFWCPYVTI